MEKSYKVKYSTTPPVESVLENKIKVGYNTVNTVSIVCLIDATVKVTGAVTGNKYEFYGAGAKVEVDIKDKNEILNKKRGRGCCGGESGKPIFSVG